MRLPGLLTAIFVMLTVAMVGAEAGAGANPASEEAAPHAAADTAHGAATIRDLARVNAGANADPAPGRSRER